MTCTPKKEAVVFLPAQPTEVLLFNKILITVLHAVVFFCAVY